MQNHVLQLVGQTLIRDHNVRNEMILNSMFTGVIVCEVPSGKIIFHNQAAENLLGHPIITVDSHSEFAKYGGIHRDGTPYKPEEYPNGRVVMFGETVQDHDMLYRRGDGSISWLRVSAVPVKDSFGNICLSVCSFHDISKEKGFEEELISTNEELKKSNSELSRFAAIAAHDLKAPLNTITSYLEMLQDELGRDLSNSAKQYMNFILKASERARNLVSQLLAFAKSGGSLADMAPVNLNDAFDIAAENLFAQIASNKALISRSDLGTIVGVESELIRLFQNLISNSLNYRRDETPAITLSVSYHDKRPTFVYRDNARGIPSDALASIFEPFKRIEGDSNTDGAGLGLAICARIVERHGGSIQVESEVGKGSVFRFTLTPQ